MKSELKFMANGSQFTKNWLAFISEFPNFRIITLSIVLCLSSNVFAQSPSQLYTTANALYKSNQFEQAAASYEKVLMQGYHTPEVYYNLGNCYFKLKKTGKAVLNFERAHKLAPEDEDIAHNLKLAQLKAVDKLIPVPQLGIVTSWNNFLSSQSSKGWGVFALVFLWASLVVFAIYYFLFKNSLLFALCSLLFIFSVATVSLAFKQSNAEENSCEAILLVENVNVKSAPDANGTDLFAIHEGIKFQLLDHVGSWTKIRLADGKVGWIEKNLFEKI
jgi:tetratricopeptide (TPR) repeat protein